MTRILIADDHPFLLAGVRAVLEAAGMKVVDAVVDGAATLAAIARHDPDVILLDVKMPDIDGITVLETLRQQGDLRPVILLTAQVDDRQLLNALGAGVNAILCKQGGSRTLVEAIGVVMQGGRAIPAELLARAAEAMQRANAAGGLAVLSPRELTLAKTAGSGLRNREIAQQMGMTEGAIKVALHRLYEKLNVTNRTELALLVRDSAV